MSISVFERSHSTHHEETDRGLIHQFRMATRATDDLRMAGNCDALNSGDQATRRGAYKLHILHPGHTSKADRRASIQTRPHEQKLCGEIGRLGPSVHIPVRTLRTVVRTSAYHTKPCTPIRSFTLGPLPGVSAHVITSERRSAAREGCDARCCAGFTAVASPGFHRIPPGIFQH